MANQEDFGFREVGMEARVSRLIVKGYEDRDIRLLKKRWPKFCVKLNHHYFLVDCRLGGHPKNLHFFLCVLNSLKSDLE